MRNGTPVNGPGQARGDGGAGVVVQRHRHRVDRAVARLHALDRGLEEIRGGDLSAADEVGQTGGVVSLVVAESTHNSLPPSLEAAMLAEWPVPCAGIMMPSS
jgi:hypothetical protein